MTPFDVKLPPIPDLQAELTKLLRQIPRGSVTTYGTLADALGNKIASRWVGQFLLDHDHTAACACHRVVRVDGQLGRYVTGDVADKTKLLAYEGVHIVDEQIVSDAPMGFEPFSDFESVAPLQTLKQFQEELVPRLRIAAPKQKITRIAGVDISYASPTVAVGAYTLHDTVGELVWSSTVTAEVKFPYISTFLSFRELPILLKLIESAQAENQLADVIVVDGSGIIHPRRSGVASMLGVLCDCATIGVTKKHLHGQFDSNALQAVKPTWVYDGEERLGAATLPPTGTKKPIFISPGHLMDVQSAVSVVFGAWQNRRLPEPIYHADRISRRAAMSG